MNRRNFLKVASVSSLLASHTKYFADAFAQEQGQPPNVLFISVDDLNDWIGCLGGYLGEVYTPNIDKLAKQGVLFANAHTPAPVCQPARVSLLTGQYPFETGVYLNRSPKNFKDGKQKTLPEHFKQCGYHAIGIGKISHTDEPQVWDKFVPVKNLQGKTPKLNGIQDVYAEDITFDWASLDIPEDEMSGSKIVKHAELILKEHYNQPIFLSVGFHEPHMPWYAPKKYFDLYPLNKIKLPLVKENDLEDLSPFARQIAYAHLGIKTTSKELSDHQRILDKNLWNSAIQAFLATISYLDATIGILLDLFYKSPYSKNAIVILWSDNGFHLGEKQHWRKASLWEEATRVPLIISDTSSNTFAHGQVCYQPVSLIDIYPTLLELCKLPQPEHHLSGNSLVSLLNNVNNNWENVAITAYGSGNYAIRTKDWRYIRYQEGSEELYNHQVDALEWYNLAYNEKYIDIKNKLASFLPKKEAIDSFLLLDKN